MKKKTISFKDYLRNGIKILNILNIPHNHNEIPNVVKGKKLQLGVGKVVIS